MSDRIATGAHYEPGATGWMVRRFADLGDSHTSVTWWYGPASGWGTTSGPLDYSARVWLTRSGAERALRSVYGYTPADSTIVRVADAETEDTERRANAPRR